MSWRTGKGVLAAVASVFVSGCAGTQVREVRTRDLFQVETVAASGPSDVSVTMTAAVVCGGLKRITILSDGSFVAGNLDACGGLGFQLTNLSSRLVAIDWDQSSIVDESGTALRVIHDGTDPAKAGDPQAVTAVPPGATVEKSVFPADFLKYQRVTESNSPYAGPADKRWVQTRWLRYPVDRERPYRLKLVLALRVRDTIELVERKLIVPRGIQREQRTGNGWPLEGEQCSSLGCATGFVCSGGRCAKTAAPAPEDSGVLEER